MHSPAEFGLELDGVSVHDMGGLGKPASPTVTGRSWVNERAREITYRPVANTAEAEEERVFALRKDPLRLEMFRRRPKDGVRLEWDEPKSVCTPVFGSTIAVAHRM